MCAMGGGRVPDHAADEESDVLVPLRGTTSSHFSEKLGAVVAYAKIMFPPIHIPSFRERQRPSSWLGPRAILVDPVRDLVA